METDEVLSVYLETGCYQETANKLGLSYDAVRKRVKRRLPENSSTLVRFASEPNIALQWIKRGREGPSAAEVASEIKDALKDFRLSKLPKSVLKAPSTDPDLATLYPLPDIHIGLLSWSKETGHNYDLKIAENTLYPVVEKLVSEAPPSKQAVILVLGDLLHSDNYNATTTKGTFQDVDGRYPKTLYSAIKFVSRS